MSPTKRWPQIRATILTVVIAINLVVAVPWGPRITENTIKKPIAQDEITNWLAFVQGLGVQMSQEAFEGWVIWTSNAIADVDQALVAPTKPFRRITGTGQAWALFATPDSRPAAIEISGRNGDEGEFELLFRRHDPAHTMLGDHLSFRRMRGIYDGQSAKPGRAYRNFNRWVAQSVFALRPDLDRVQAAFRRRHTVPPTQPPDPEVKIEHARILKKERL